MDFLSAPRRRVNLGGSSGRSSAAAATDRENALRQARIQREQREKQRKKEKCATTIQHWWRGRHAHALQLDQARKEWDATIAATHSASPSPTSPPPTATSSPTPATLPTSIQLRQLIRSYLHFSKLVVPTRIQLSQHEGPPRSQTNQPVSSQSVASASSASSHPHTGQRAATIASNVAAIKADLQRWRQLVKLMVTSFRCSSRQHNIGALILDENGKASSSSSSTITQWVHLHRKVASLLLQHIAAPSSDSSADTSGLELSCLWMMLDAGQWGVTKDPSMSAEQKSKIQRAQATLIEKLIELPEVARSVSSAPLTSPTSASPSPVSVNIDLFRCLRVRIIELTQHLPVDPTAVTATTPVQPQHKTQLALLFATVIRAVTLSLPPVGSMPTPVAPSSSSSAAASTSSLSPSQTRFSPVLHSFIRYILTIPTFSHRLRFMQLQALIPSFVVPHIWDRCMETITLLCKEINAHAANSPVVASTSTAASQASPAALSIAPAHCSSISHSQLDAITAALPPVYPNASAAGDALNDSMMDIDASASASASSSSSGSSSALSSAASLLDVGSNQSVRGPLRISGLAWLLGNLLDFVGVIDESKSASAARSFTLFLGALEQLIASLPQLESPDAATTTSPLHALWPPLLTKQMALLSDRSFLDRLCRRLMDEPDDNTAAATAMHSQSPPPSTRPPLESVPVICALIDKILFKWAGTSQQSILNTLVFSTDVLPRLWGSIRKSGLIQRIENAGMEASKALLAHGAIPSSSNTHTIPPIVVALLDSLFSDPFFHLLPLFSTLYTHLLLILGDDEFSRGKPFNLEQYVVPMVRMLKVLLYHLFWSGYSTSPTPTRLRERFAKLFQQLRDRQSRRPFMATHEWLFHAAAASEHGGKSAQSSASPSSGASSTTSPSLIVPLSVLKSELFEEREARQDLGESAAMLVEGRASALVSSIPFVLPFSDRVSLLYALIEEDKRQLRYAGAARFDHGLGHQIRISRGRVLEDGYDALINAPAHVLKGRIQVSFTDEYGLVERGVDGGGLFKEFLTQALKQAFDPSYNLFSTTPQHHVYPNPAALDLESDVDPNSMDVHEGIDLRRQTLQYFYLVGSLVGKALYEGIQIETQLALFFLRSCIGLNNYIDDLQGLDPVIHQSLMHLKHLDPSVDIDDLGLTFSVDRQVFGVVKSHELVPGGANMAVTNENKVRFLYLLTDYYLRGQISAQTNAFQQGLSSIIDLSWLRMFAAEELQLLISGSHQIDLRDMIAHTTYSHGYSANHELIRWFWQILSELNEEQMAAFLRFCTSCSRAPLLGFGQLNPPFCIQHVDADENEQRLPTAATCVNLLRLPRFTSKERLKEKLLYAITTSSTGFGLT